MKLSKPSLREIVLFGMLGALTFAMKLAMAGLPNIEPVTLTLLVYGAVFGWKALYPMYVYVIMEILYFGLGTWNICYFYIWLIPVATAIFLRKMQPALVWALAAGVFGLLFGALCGIVDIFIGGLGYAVSKWITGILFDISHCVGNFLMALILFVPLRNLVAKLYKKMRP